MTQTLPKLANSTKSAHSPPAPTSNPS